MIEGNKLCVKAPNGISILDEVSISVNSTDYSIITGPSGSGKSTLLNVLGLITPPSTGELRINGSLVSYNKKANLARLRNEYFGYIFQDFKLIPELTALENVLLPTRYHPTKDRDSSMTKARELISNLGMSGKEKSLPEELSGGQRQRIAIARSLILSPAMILADEPTGNLDSKNSQSVKSMFDEIHSDGVGILCVTHDNSFTKKASKLVNVMDGRLLP